MARKPRQPKAGSQPPRPARVSEQARAKLVKAALEKHRRGERLTARELDALDRFEREREDEARRQHYASCPKAHYLELASADSRTVHRHADRFSLPLRGSSIDLSAVLARVHQLLDQYGPALQAAITGDDPELVGGDSPALEKLREEKWRLARLDRLEREQQLVPRDQVHHQLAVLANLLRSAAETLRRRFGNDAGEILDHALDSFERHVEQALTDGDDAHQPEGDPSP